MLDIIVSAIKNKQRIQFTYGNIEQIIEPHTVGITITEKYILRGFRTDAVNAPRGHEWALYKLEKIQGFKLLNEHFDKPREDYKRGDKCMKKIYAEI